MSTCLVGCLQLCMAFWGVGGGRRIVLLELWFGPKCSVNSFLPKVALRWLKVYTHLCDLLCGQDRTWSASSLVDHMWSKFCTLNFLTTPISIALFNRISKFLKPLLKMRHTGCSACARSNCVGASIIIYFYVFNLTACGLETVCSPDHMADHVRRTSLLYFHQSSVLSTHYQGRRCFFFHFSPFACFQFFHFLLKISLVPS